MPADAFQRDFSAVSAVRPILPR